MIKASQICQIVVPEQSGKMKLSESYITESLSVTLSRKEYKLDMEGSHEIPLARSVPDSNSELLSSMVVVQNNFAAKKDVEAIQRKWQLSVSTWSTINSKPLTKQSKFKQQRSGPAASNSETRSPPCNWPRTTIIQSRMSCINSTQAATGSHSSSVQLSIQLPHTAGVPSSVTANDMACALWAQIAPSKKNVKSICTHIPLYLIYRVIKY